MYRTVNGLTFSLYEACIIYHPVIHSRPKNLELLALQMPVVATTPLHSLSAMADNMDNNNIPAEVDGVLGSGQEDAEQESKMPGISMSLNKKNLIHESFSAGGGPQKKKPKTTAVSSKERQKLYHYRKIFQKQIDQLAKERKADPLKPKVKVFVGTMRDGKWRDATQLTNMGQVYLPPRIGCKRVMFRGAIVAFGDPESRDFSAVPESNFMIDSPCYAKHGGQSTAKILVAKKITGICHQNAGDSTGYIMVRWSNGETQ